MLKDGMTPNNSKLHQGFLVILCSEMLNTLEELQSKKKNVIFSEWTIFKTCCNEEKQKKKHVKKCWKDVDHTNKYEVIEHVQFNLFNVLGHEQECDHYSRKKYYQTQL